MGARAIGSAGALRRQAPAGIALVLWSAVAMAGCSETSTAPSPRPAPEPGSHHGPVAIEYVSASVTPGSTIAGCGTQLTGCLGRLTVTYRLRPTSAGPVLRADAHLHGMNNLACLSASLPAFQLEASTARQIVMTFDQADATCGAPLDVRHMSLTLTGPVETDSRQEWAVEYRFLP